MAKFYGKRSCSKPCESECCYFEKYSYVIGKNKAITLSEVERLRNAVKHSLHEFKPEYRERIKRIVENNEFMIKDKYNEDHLTSDTSLPGISPCMGIMYYPCRFLSGAEKVSNTNKACMIYPFRFQICKNTKPEDRHGCKEL